MRKTTYLLPILVILVAAALSSVFIVDEREKALVLQFGRVVTVKEEPGVAFKIPLIQEVVAYDDRILSREVGPLEITPLDDRRLVVDAFARYRIADVKQFRQAVGTGGIELAERRLDNILRAQTREVLGSVSSNDILSSDRATLMLRIRNAAISEARGLGLEVIDVRLKRTDLPQANLEATFARMRAERERERRPIGPWLNWSRMPSGNQKSHVVKRMQSGTQFLQQLMASIRSSLSSIGP